MKKNISYIKKIGIQTNPENLISYDIENEFYRKDYTELIRSLTIYIFVNLSNRYSFISKKERYHLLLPVLGYISGEWSTYIINTFYHLKESPLRKSIKNQKKNISLKDINYNVKPLSSYTENSESLYYDQNIRSLISIILDNDEANNKVIKEFIRKESSSLKKESLNKKEAFDLRKSLLKYLRKLKLNNLICGYNFLSVLKILFLTFNNDVKNIYYGSRNHTNKFIKKNLQNNKNILDKYFSSAQKELFADLVFLYLPLKIQPSDLQEWMTNEKKTFLHPIKFCGPYVRDIKVIKSMFIQRLNKKIIIGSQHGSNYGYSFNHIKNDFSEFLLDGFISTGYKSKYTSKWPKPYLGFFPISPLFAKLTKNNHKENTIGNPFTCLYVETQFNLCKSVSTDRMNYSPTIAKINTYKLIKSFLDSIDEKDFDRLFIKPWIFEEKISPLKDSNLFSLRNIKIVKSKLSTFIKKFEGLIILDDLSTPMLESIVLNKPILIIISRLNRHTSLGEKFFEQMQKNKYIVSSIKEAKETIKKFQQNPKKYKENQKKLFKEFRSVYCNPEYYSPRFTAFQINKTLKSSSKKLE